MVLYPALAIFHCWRFFISLSLLKVYYLSTLLFSWKVLSTACFTISTFQHLHNNSLPVDNNNDSNNITARQMWLSELQLPNEVSEKSRYENPPAKNVDNFYRNDRKYTINHEPLSSGYRVSKTITVLDNTNNNNIDNEIYRPTTTAWHSRGRQPKLLPAPQNTLQNAPTVSVADICNEPELVSQFYWYCYLYYFGHRPRATNPFESFNTFAFYDATITPDVINFACGLPIAPKTTTTATIDFDLIITNQLCNNLILSDALNFNDYVFQHPEQQFTYKTVKHHDQIQHLTQTIRGKVRILTETAKNTRKLKLFVELAFSGRANVNPSDFAVINLLVDVQEYVTGSFDIDGIAIKWIRGNNNDAEIELLSKVVDIFVGSNEINQHTSTQQKQLSVGLLVPYEFIKTHSQNPLFIDNIVNRVSFINILPAPYFTENGNVVLEPVNKLFIDLVGNLNTLSPTSISEHGLKIASKLFLPLELGATYYTLPREPGFSTATVQFGGRAQRGLLLQTLISGGTESGVRRDELSPASEACTMIHNENFQQEVYAYYYGANTSDEKRRTHEMVAVRPRIDFLNFETPCTMIEKLQLFREHQIMADTGKQVFAGIYIPDVTNDDVRGVCSKVSHGLLRIIQRASVGPMELRNADEQCKRGGDYSWSANVVI